MFRKMRGLLSAQQWEQQNPFLIANEHFISTFTTSKPTIICCCPVHLWWQEEKAWNGLECAKWSLE